MADQRGYSPELRTVALLEALPYIQRFRGAVEQLPAEQGPGGAS